MNKRNNKGLTLIELLLVVVILGILAAIAIPRITTSATTARTNTCLTNQDVLNTQIELYNVANYPSPSLAVLVADSNYFPEGSPVCPSSGTYTKNATTHRCSCDATGH